MDNPAAVPLKEATREQHFGLKSGERAKFVSGGVLETRECRDCARSAPSEKPVARQDDLHLHLPAWRQALEVAKRYALQCNDPDDAAYWRHEIKAIDRIASPHPGEANSREISKLEASAWAQAGVVSGYWIKEKPDNEFVNVCNGDLRKLDEATHAIHVPSETNPQPVAWGQRDICKQPYSLDEQRVANWFYEKGTGGGDDPIGSLIASHEYLVAERATLPRPALSREEISDDHPYVIAAAHAIAEHGFCRPWDDFLPVYAHDTDQGDILEYAKAAVAAILSAQSQATVTNGSGTANEGG